MTLKFGTWNVQGCRNKMEEIIREIHIMKKDLVALTEKNGIGNKTLGKYTHFQQGEKIWKGQKRIISFNN